jgi:RNA polymerase sigma factor (sigma-70 family)
MASRAYGQVVHQIERLFGRGSVGGLSEWQLLDRYATHRDEAAFEALVARHGPMVLGVCRRMLDDPHQVEDAFQATFLILVRRAGSLGPGDAVGCWLYGVARRVALRARSESARRRSKEVSAAWADEVAGAPPAGPSDLAPVLDEELGRLPPRYRAPVVLCYLEGLTHEEAASRLRWPVGSVKGRLARARTLLKHRLARRGLAPAAGAVAAALARDARAAVPEPLRLATVRAAVSLAAGRAAPAIVSASVAHLVEGGLSAMFLTKLKVAAAIAGACGGLALGAWALAQPTRGGQGSPDAPSAAVSPEQNEPMVREVLAKPLALEIRQAPLRDVLKAIKQATSTGSSPGVPIFVEPEGLAEAGASIESAVTIDARNVPLEAALDRALRPLKLAATSRDGLLVVTSRSEAALIEARRRAEAPPETTGGPLEESNPAQWLARMKDRRTVYSAASPGDQADPELEEKTRAILDALREPIAMSFANETPLEDLLRYVRSATESPKLPRGIPVYVDPVGLTEAEKTMTSPVTIDLEGVPLRDSLRLVLKQLGLTYSVADGLLTISWENPEGDPPTPLDALGDRALRGELSVREMDELVAMYEARDKVRRVATHEHELPARPEVAFVPAESPEAARNRRIQEALDRVVTLQIEEMPVLDAIEKVRRMFVGPGRPEGIPTYVARHLLLPSNVASTQKVAIDLKDVKLGTALRLLLGQANLGYAVKDGLLIIDNVTSPELRPEGPNAR